MIKPLTKQFTCVLVVALLGLNGCATQRSPIASSSDAPVSTTTYPDPPAPATLPPEYERSYVVFGKRYYILKSASGFREQGIASWYGPKFHGRKTANGETYNMHGMSAAHKNLPLGSWVRVTNLDNERTIDVRINDRGPFVENRVIDLSLAAAKALDVVGPGTAPVYLVALEGTYNYTAQEPYDSSSAPIGSGGGGGNVITATIDRPAVIDSRPAPPEPSPVVVAQLPPVEVIQAPSPIERGPATRSPEVVTAQTRPTVSTTPNFNSGSYIQVASFGQPDNANRMKKQLEQSGLNNVIIQTQTVNERLVHRVRLGPLTSAAQQQELLARLLDLGFIGARVVSN